MRNTVATAITALAFCVLMGLGVEAQQLPLTLKLQQADINLQENAAQISQWARWAHVSLAVVWLVGFLGIAMAAIQATQIKWKGVATAVAGAIISATTMIGSATIPADYKTLNHLVSKGNRLMASANLFLNNGKSASTDADRQFALDEIEKKLAEFSNLSIRDETLMAAGQGTGWPFRNEGLLAVVHAAETQSACGCFRSIPKTGRGYIYACGTAAGKSLAEAHGSALQEAAKGIASHLLGQMKNVKIALAEQDLVDYVRRVAVEFDSCPGPGGSASLSVILRFPEALGREQALTAFVSKPPTSVEPTSQRQRRLTVSSIRVVADGSAGVTGWTFDIFVDGRTVASIPYREYSDRPAGRSTVTLSGPSAVQALFEIPQGQYWLLEIRGKRSFGDDTATGAAAINEIGKPIEIAVANRAPKDGSFVFTVTVAKP